MQNPVFEEFLGWIELGKCEGHLECGMVGTAFVACGSGIQCLLVLISLQRGNSERKVAKLTICRELALCGTTDFF